MKQIYKYLIMFFLLISCNEERNSNKDEFSKKVECKKSDRSTLLHDTIVYEFNNLLISMKRYVYRFEVEDWMIDEYVEFNDSLKIIYEKSYFLFPFFKEDSLVTYSSAIHEKFIGNFNGFDSCRVEIWKNNLLLSSYKTSKHNIDVNYTDLENGFNYFIVNIFPYKAIFFEKKKDTMVRYLSYSKVIYKIAN